MSSKGKLLDWATRHVLSNDIGACAKALCTTPHQLLKSIEKGDSEAILAIVEMALEEINASEWLLWKHNNETIQTLWHDRDHE